tara:strand:+ start:149 stop:547 length:399 start_codon:yes stop_codon:yes gene_type:complete
MEFNSWKNEINDIIYNSIKLNLTDLPDEDYYLMWEEKKCPNEVAQIIIKDYNKLEKKLLTRNEYEQTFEEWKKDIDNLIFKKIGLHCEDLPDIDYWSSWEKNVFSEVIVHQVILKYENAEVWEFKEKRQKNE